jgi:hypothetical protein
LHGVTFLPGPNLVQEETHGVIFLPRPDLVGILFPGSETLPISAAEPG